MEVAWMYPLADVRAWSRDVMISRLRACGLRGLGDVVSVTLVSQDKRARMPEDVLQQPSRHAAYLSVCDIGHPCWVEARVLQEPDAAQPVKWITICQRGRWNQDKLAQSIRSINGIANTATLAKACIVDRQGEAYRADTELWKYDAGKLDFPVTVFLQAAPSPASEPVATGLRRGCRVEVRGVHGSVVHATLRKHLPDKGC